jgi:hypothetical protein
VAIFSVLAAVIPPLPIFPRSWLQDQSHSMAICRTFSMVSKMYRFSHWCHIVQLPHPKYFFCKIFRALLCKSADCRTAPLTEQTYAATFVTGRSGQNISLVKEPWRSWSTTA